jgi:hypothetical protein
MRYGIGVRLMIPAVLAFLPVLSGSARMRQDPCGGGEP